MTDIAALDADERAEIALFLESLAPEQWEVPSLCDRWRVRDVVGHMLVAYEVGAGRMLWEVARSGFSPDEAIARLAIARASRSPTAQLVAAWKTTRRRWYRLAGAAPPHGLFYDHYVHHQDMRIPLGEARVLPREKLFALLDCIPRYNGFRSRGRARGLQLVATDLAWSHGDGPLVTGTAEALLLALAGRPVALADLQGGGLELLSSRVSATAS